MTMCNGKRHMQKQNLLVYLRELYLEFKKRHAQCRHIKHNNTAYITI